MLAQECKGRVFCAAPALGKKPVAAGAGTEVLRAACHRLVSLTALVRSICSATESRRVTHYGGQRLLPAFACPSDDPEAQKNAASVRAPQGFCRIHLSLATQNGLRNHCTCRSRSASAPAGCASPGWSSRALCKRWHAAVRSTARLRASSQASAATCTQPTRQLVPLKPVRTLHIMLCSLQCSFVCALTSLPLAQLTVGSRLRHT